MFFMKYFLIILYKLSKKVLKKYKNEVSEYAQQHKQWLELFARFLKIGIISYYMKGFFCLCFRYIAMHIRK